MLLNYKAYLLHPEAALVYFLLALGALVQNCSCSDLHQVFRSKEIIANLGFSTNSRNIDPIN
jgi:hypothetical protein